MHSLLHGLHGVLQPLSRSCVGNHSGSLLLPSPLPHHSHQPRLNNLFFPIPHPAPLPCSPTLVSALSHPAPCAYSPAVHPGTCLAILTPPSIAAMHPRHPPPHPAHLPGGPPGGDRKLEPRVYAAGEAGAIRRWRAGHSYPGWAERSRAESSWPYCLSGIQML